MAARSEPNMKDTELIEIETEEPSKKFDIGLYSADMVTDGVRVAITGEHI